MNKSGKLPARPIIHSTEGSVGLKAGMDAVKRNNKEFIICNFHLINSRVITVR
jgi:hypothetical protein